MHDFYPRNNYYSFATAPPHKPPPKKDCGFLGLGCALESTVNFFTGGGPNRDKPLTPQQEKELKKITITPQNKAKLQKDHPSTKSGETVHPFDTSKGDPNTAFIADRSSDPLGCKNCNFGDTMCEFMKAGCDAQHSFGGNIPWTLIAIGGGALILVLILLKRR
jgi:hypothetical protein